MGTALTNPVAVPALTFQEIIRVEFQIPHKLVNGSLVMDRANVGVQYDVATKDAAGKLVSRATRTVPFASWPQSFKTDIASVYAKIEQDARANGLLGAGTDEAI